MTVGTTFMETVGTPGPARADLSVTLTAPGTVSRGAVGTVKITVTNKGPSAATKIAAAVYIPPTFTVTNAGGGTTIWGVTVLTVPTLSPGTSATFTVSVKAGNRTGRSVLAAITAATTTDPNPYNNITAAISTIK
jgi:subtilase family serine protease